MIHDSTKRHAGVWFVLMALTLLAFAFLESGHGIIDSMTVKMIVVSAIAAIKAVLVAHFFMELADAPSKAKFVVYLWLILLAVLIVLMPWIAELLGPLDIKH